MTALSTQMARLRRAVALGVLLAVPLLPLTGCGGGDDSERGRGGGADEEQGRDGDEDGGFGY